MAEPRNHDEFPDDEKAQEGAMDRVEDIRGRDENEDTDPDSPDADIDRDDMTDD